MERSNTQPYETKNLKAEIEKLKAEIEKLKVGCPLCEVGKCECDCDRCGVWGCYKCVSGGHGKDEDLNLCYKCEDDDESA